MSSPVVNKPQEQTGVQEQKPDILPTLFGEGYGIYGVRKQSFVASFLFNILFVALIVAAELYVPTHTEEIKKIAGNVVDISPYIMPDSATQAGGGGGGGDRDKLEATKGKLPKFAKEQFTPPVVVVRNESPKLPVVPTV